MDRLILVMWAFVVGYIVFLHPQSANAEIEDDYRVYNGTYILEVSRIWRDEYWESKNDKYYYPGRLERLSQARVKIENGIVRLERAGEVNGNNSGGPIFEKFDGRIDPDGTLKIRAKVNYLVTKPAPFDLAVNFDLDDWRTSSGALTAPTVLYSQAYASHVTLLAVNGPDFSIDEADQSQERLAAEQAERRRLAAAQAERERLTAREAEAWREYYDGTSLGNCDMPARLKAPRKYPSIVRYLGLIHEKQRVIFRSHISGPLSRCKVTLLGSVNFGYRSNQHWNITFFPRSGYHIAVQYDFRPKTGFVSPVGDWICYNENTGNTIRSDKSFCGLKVLDL
jgi:hypothetical protein